jgi:hypothetical protein
VARAWSRCPATTGTPWTYDAFARRFGNHYRTLHAGEELRITAAGGNLGGSGGASTGHA